jgi:hypothetical protein
MMMLRFACVLCRMSQHSVLFCDAATAPGHAWKKKRSCENAQSDRSYLQVLQGMNGYPHNPTANEGRLWPVPKSRNGRFCSDHERHRSLIGECGPGYPPPPDSIPVHRREVFLGVTVTEASIR